MQRLLRDDAADLTTFEEVKRATVAYLEEFVTNLDQRKHVIADAVGRIEGRTAVLHQRAIVGADLPSLSNTTDRVPIWLAARQARWDSVRHWFRPVDGAAPATLSAISPGAPL